MERCRRAIKQQMNKRSLPITDVRRPEGKGAVKSGIAAARNRRAASDGQEVRRPSAACGRRSEGRRDQGGSVDGLASPGRKARVVARQTDEAGRPANAAIDARR